MLRKFNGRGAIRGVAKAWKQQYHFNGAWLGVITGSSESIYRKLAALDVETATSADVDKIIGTGGWVSAWCSNCKEHATSAVEIDNGDTSTHLCRECVKKAAKLLRV